MRKKTVKYTDDKGEMAGDLVRIKDLLPPPDEPAESVTVTLHGDMLAFFQREANQRHTGYEQIIRDLVRSYARSHHRAQG
jgi:hypothetical protein